MGSTPEAAQVREAMETVASFAHLKYIYLAAAARGCSIASVAPQIESGCIDDVEFLNENGRPFAAASVKSMLAWHLRVGASAYARHVAGRTARAAHG